MLRILGALLCAAVLLAGCSRTDQLNEDEKALLLDVTNFHEYGVPAGGSYRKNVDYVDRTIALNYEYETGKFYLYNRVSLHSTAADALMMTRVERLGLSIGMRDQLQELPLQLSEALQSQMTLKLLLRDGRPVGNVFYGHLGRKSILLVFTGVYFDTAEAFEALFAEQIANIEAYEYQDPLYRWVTDRF